MKRYINKREFFVKEFGPEKYAGELNYTQVKFTQFLATIRDLREEGELSASEKAMIQKIKDEIAKLKKQIPSEDPSKFDFELAKIFHKHLKVNRAYLNDWGFWRWLSMNFFIEEIQWRWAKKYREKSESIKAAVAIHDHLTGKSKNHRIFCRRFFAIGIRLCDNGSYKLLDKISENMKANVQGGYGDFINYLVDTKLLSFNDNVVKTMGKLLLSDKAVMSKDVVVKSFKRYNGFKNRMMSDASEDIFRNEIINYGL